MKKLTSFVLLPLLTAGLVRAEWFELDPAETSIRLLQDSPSAIRLECTVDGFQTSPVDIDGETYHRVALPGGALLLNEGAPELPILAESVIIPDDQRIRLRVLDGEYTEFDLAPAPSKGNLPRTVNPDDVPFRFGPEYSGGLYPEATTRLRDPYILRDYRGLAVVFQPFQYDPGRGVLRVWTRMEVELYADGPGRVNVIERSHAPQSVSTSFAELYRNHFLNYGENQRYTPLEEQGNMLVIADDAYLAQVADFVDWKRQRGMDIELVPLSEVGTTYGDVDTYVDDYYNLNGLTFLLLVGDDDDVPTYPYSSDASDPSYALILGGDSYPEIFVGRFSANSTADAQTQADRSVDYEKLPQAGADWYHKGCGVASNQGPGDDNEYDNEHVDNIRLDLLGYTYSEVDQLYDPDVEDWMVSDALNDGRSIVNYTGHGSQYSWGSSAFDVNDIDNLVNDHMLPFIISVACVNGDFDNGITCFGEVWMRATNGAAPTGAVGIYASSVNQSWNPPMAAQDESVDLLVAEEKNTFGGLCYNGSMQMMDEYGADGEYMYKTWHIFGDPSLMVRTDTPAALNTSHAGSILSTATTFNVNAPGIPDVLVTLYYDGTVYGSALTDAGGTALVPVAGPLPVGEDLTVTAFKYNCLTSLTAVSVIPPEGPYVIYDSHVVEDANGQLNPGETCDMTITVENVGVENATEVTLTLSTADPYVTVTDGVEYYGDIPVGGQASVFGGFQVVCDTELPDGHAVNFDLEASSPGGTWNSMFTALGYAPALEISQVLVLDGDNGRLDPGETAGVQVMLHNAGSADALNLNALLSSSDLYITINVSEDDLPLLAAGADGPLDFEVSVDPGAPLGHPVEFDLTVSGDNCSLHESFGLNVGLTVEDFESGTFASYPWEMAGDADWIIDTEAYEGTYCAKSGEIGHSATSQLMLIADVLSADQISFFYRVSSEANYDYLRFYLDGGLLAEWAGEIGWTEASFPVSAGIHSFTWSYEKDYTVDGGADCAWLDYILLPPFNVPADTTPPEIVHEGLPNSSDTLGPWTVSAEILDPSGIASAILGYRFDGGGWTEVSMNRSRDTYSADIPGPASIGTVIDYRITAVDASENANSVTTDPWTFLIVAPTGLEYCQDFEGGLDDFTVETYAPGGNTCEINTYSGQGNTPYISYSNPDQEDHAALISPVFDCTEQATLELSFWHHLRMGWSGSWTDAYVRGSTDGGANWDYLLGEWHANNPPEEIIVEGVETVDCSSWASGEAQVRVMFEFHDMYDWYWHVDDVCLTGTLLPPDLDPVVLYAAYVGGGQVQLSWDPVPGATSYDVYTAEEAYETWTFLDNTPSTIYVVSAGVDEQGFYHVITRGDSRADFDLPAARIDPDRNRRAPDELEKSYKKK